jgi:hypothetical protein
MVWKIYHYGGGFKRTEERQENPDRGRYQREEEYDRKRCELPASQVSPTVCRLEVGVTAGWKPALHFLSAAARRLCLCVGFMAVSSLFFEHSPALACRLSLKSPASDRRHARE